MKIPNQTGPIVTKSAKTEENAIYPSSGGTCSCDYGYGPTCSTGHDNCNPGYHAICETSMYGCGCQCTSS